MNNRAADSRGHSAAFVCVSLNPAIDTRLVLAEFQVGRVNRVSETHRAPGGKAAHVAMALQGLGENPKWLGFTGGATGNELMEGLRRLKIEALSVPTVHDTRVNLEIIDTLGVTEIREYGSTSIQVMRRMRAMLEELRDEVRPEHRLAVEEELARLQATVARTFADSVDLDRANTADPQGIGGRTAPPGHRE